MSGPEACPDEGGTAESRVVQRLRERLGDAVLEVWRWRNETTVRLAPEGLLPACRLLREEDDLAFDLLSSIAGVDRLHLPEPAPRFEVVYHLCSLRHKRRLRLKVRVEADRGVPSVTGVWPTADWHEREVFDLFGVPFEGHPDLTRILMPDDWEGHPLRKDYPVAATPPWWEEEPA